MDNLSSENSKRIHIAIIGPENFISLAKSYVDVYDNVDILFRLTYGEKSVMLLPELEELNVDAIIAGQINTMYIKPKTNIPIIVCKSNVFDILEAINRSRNYNCKDIGLSLVNFEAYDINVAALTELTGINIVPISHTSTKELEQKLSSLKDRGIRVVIGSTLSVSIAQQLGMIGIMAYNLKNTIAVCLERAVEVVRAARETADKEKLQLMAMDYVLEGIVHINLFGRIVAFNHHARKIFSIKTEHRLVGRYIDQVLDELRLTDVIRSGETTVKKVERIQGQSLMISRFPIVINQQTAGAVAVFQRIEDIQHLESGLKRELEQQGFIARHTFSDIVYHDEKLHKLINIAKEYAKSDLPILIQGETGTGKELFAQSIHNASRRANKPFVAINCASLPANLLESELFGYASGAFTGASSVGKKGLFELAHKGTLFLDEINSISRGFQVKLLRAIEEQEIIRIGGNKIIPVDVRIISSTNENMHRLIGTNSFRKDLYYRVCVLQLDIPPLRERRHDIPFLIEALSRNHLPGKNPDIGYLKERMVQVLHDYQFPGNVRELRSFLERFFILIASEQHQTAQQIDDFIRFCIYGYGVPSDIQYSRPSVQVSAYDEERARLLALLERCNYNKTKAALQLGCGRNTLYRRMKHFGIDQYSSTSHKV